MARRQYPFVPKSNLSLLPGQFWDIPLSNGRHACGRVLQVAGDEALPGRTMFLAGLMDWSGASAPTEGALQGVSGVVDQGKAHVKTVHATGGAMRGHRALEADGVQALVRVTHRLGGTVWLLRGYDHLRPASPEEAATVPVLGAWGFNFIQDIAEKRFVK